MLADCDIDPAHKRPIRDHFQRADPCHAVSVPARYVGAGYSRWLWVQDPSPPMS